MKHASDKDQAVRDGGPIPYVGVATARGFDVGAGEYVYSDSHKIKLIDPPSFVKTLGWSWSDTPAEPLDEPFHLEVGTDSSHLDDWMITLSYVMLASRRFLNLLDRFSVLYETYPTRFVDRKTGRDLDLEHRVFRILEQHEAIDVERMTTWEIKGGNLLKYDELLFKPSFLERDLPVALFRETTRGFILATFVAHEAFAREMKRQNMRGVRFKELALQNRGMRRTLTPLPERATSEPPSPPPPTVTARALSEAEAGRITGTIREAYTKLDLLSDAPPTDIVKRIQAQVRDLREQQTDVPLETLQEWAVQLGHLWGEQVVRAYDWHWVAVDTGESEVLGVVPTDEAYRVLPLNFVWQHLQDAEREETVMLLFNMLARAEESGAPRRPGALQGLS